MFSLLTAIFFAVLLVLSVSSSFSAQQASSQSSFPPPIVSEGSSDLQESPIHDPTTSSIINQYPDSQTYPYQDPYVVLPSPTQTLPDELLPHEKQLLLQGNSVVDVTAPETTITSATDGNNVLPWEGVTSTSNKIVLTIQGTDDTAVAGFRCILDNLQQDPSICETNPIVAENLQPGVHLFQISSVDSAGNVDATPAVFSWNVIVSDQYIDSQQMLHHFNNSNSLYYHCKNNQCSLIK